MERPLLLPLLAMIAGLSTAGLFEIFYPQQLILPLLFSAFLAIFLRNRFPFIVLLCCLLFLWGDLVLKPIVQPDFTADHLVHFVSDEPIAVEGVIDSRPEASKDGAKIYLRVECLCQGNSCRPASGRLLLFVGDGRVPFLSGDRIRFIAKLHRPRNYGIPGEFDFVRYLALRKVYVTAFVARADDAVLLRSKVAFPIQHRIDSIAARLGNYIDTIVPPAEGAILRALLLGDMGYVTEETRDAYSRTGVNHILSISGFHVGIIAFCLFQLLFWFARHSEFLLLHVNLRRFILLVTLPVVIFYLFLSGAAPATVRSVIMIGAYILALILERETDPINSLVLAAVAILACSPAALFDISFQLSFLALWGILVLTPLLMAPFGFLKEGILQKILLFFMASVAATVVTILPVAHYFQRASATGLLSNFFIVPLMGYGAVILGFAALPWVGIAPVVANFLLLAAAFLVNISNRIINLLDQIPLLPSLTTSRTILLLLYLFLVLITVGRSTRVKHISCCALVVLFLITVVGSNGKIPQGMRITFFSIGQGDSALIEFSDGRRMLVDGGGSAREGGADVGKRLLAPALCKMGVNRIDYLVLTHPHPDHLQGVKYVLEHFPVGEFWETGIGCADEGYLALKGVLGARKVPVRYMNGSCGPLAIGNAVIEPLAPIKSGNVASEDLNDESMVFKVVYGSSELLFTGDMGFTTEHALLKQPDRLRSTILKVPHHGSRFSSSDSFLWAVSPSVAVISAGYGNSFHLPAQETVMRLKDMHVRTYRTDLDGTVQIELNRGIGTIAWISASRYFH